MLVLVLPSLRSDLRTGENDVAISRESSSTVNKVHVLDFFLVVMEELLHVILVHIIRESLSQKGPVILGGRVASSSASISSSTTTVSSSTTTVITTATVTVFMAIPAISAIIASSSVIIVVSVSSAIPMVTTTASLSSSVIVSVTSFVAAAVLDVSSASALATLVATSALWSAAALFWLEFLVKFDFDVVDQIRSVFVEEILEVLQSDRKELQVSLTEMFLVELLNSGLSSDAILEDDEALAIWSVSVVRPPDTSFDNFIALKELGDLLQSGVERKSPGLHESIVGMSALSVHDADHGRIIRITDESTIVLTFRRFEHLNVA